jgi:SAM-dependent methyltransferase
MAPYDALAAVYDRWVAANDYAGWARFLHAKFASYGVHEVLDVCCGTGRMTAELLSLGYSVSGVDGSAAMLAVAERTLPTGTRLRHVVLPAEESLSDSVDAAICCFDSVNYFATDEDLAGLFRCIAGSLRPGGLFVFDVNTPVKLQTIFGNSHYGDDLGDFAYVWRNRMDTQSRTVRFLITLFRREGDIFLRQDEEHVQRWFTDDELSGAAGAAGFEVVTVADDYSDSEPGQSTLRQTWLLRRT